MSGIIIDVKANADSANRDLKQVNESLKNIQTTTNKMSSSLSNLATGFAAVLASGLTVNYLKSVSDNFVQMSNKIAQVTGKTNDLIYAQQELLKIAQATNGTNLGTVTIYNKLGLALKKNKVSMEDTLAATESISKAISLSGATVEAANAGILQLGQGLSAGALRGEELNSVMENIPRVALAIADSLNMTTGEMRKLAAEGGLTRELVFDAMLSQAEEINKEFALMAPTLGQSLSKIGQAAQIFTNEFLKGLGGGSTLSKLLTGLADRLIEMSGTIATDTAIFVGNLKQGLAAVGILGSSIGNVFGALGGQFLNALPSIVEVRTLAGDILSVFNTIVEPIKAVFSNLVKSIFNTFKDVFTWNTDVEKALQRISKIKFSLDTSTLIEYGAAFRKLADAIKANSSSIGVRTKKFFNAIKSDLTVVLKYFHLIPSNPFEFKTGSFGPLISSLTQILRSLTGVKTSVFAIGTIFTDTFGSDWKPLLNFFSDIADIVKAKLTVIINAIKDFVGINTSTFTTFANNITNNVWSRFTDRLVDITDSLGDRVKGSFNKLKGYITNVFTNLEIKLGVKTLDIADANKGFTKKITDKLLSGFSSREFKFKFSISDSPLESFIFHLDAMFTSIAVLALSGLGRTIEIIKNFATKVKDYFWDIYEDVVGHSSWPDLIDGIVDYTRRLTDAETPIRKFANFVKSTFEKLKDTSAFEVIGKVKDTIGDSNTADVFKSIGNPFEKGFDFSKAFETIKTELPLALKTALTAVGLLAVGLLFPAGLFKTGLIATLVTSLATTGSLAAERFGSDLFGESFLTAAAHGIGAAAGYLVTSFINSIPQILNALLGIINGFVQGFLGQLPSLIGGISKALFGLADLVGIGGPLGIVTGILFGAGVLHLLSNIKAVKSATKAIANVYTSISSTLAGQNGVISSIVFGKSGFLGASNTVAGIGLILSSLGAFDSIFGDSVIVRAAGNAGLLYVMIFGKNGLRTIQNGMETILAKLAISVRQSITGVAKGAGESLLGQLLYGTPTERSTIYNGFTKFLSDTVARGANYAAGIALSISKGLVDITSTILLGQSGAKTKQALKARFDDVLSLLKKQLKKLGDFLLKNEVVSSLWEGGKKGLAGIKSGVAATKTTTFDPSALALVPKADYGRPDAGNAALKAAKNTAASLQSVSSSASIAIAQMFEKANQKLGQQVGPDGMLGTAINGSRGRMGLGTKLAIGAAIMLMFTGIAKAAEDNSTKLAGNGEAFDGLWDHFTQWMSDNPFVTFSATAVTAIGSIVLALKMLGRDGAYGAIKDKLSTVVNGNSSEIMTRQAVRGRVAMGTGVAAGIGAAYGAYNAKPGEAAQDAMYYGSISGLIASFIPALSAKLGTAFKGVVIDGILAGIAGAFSAVVAVFGGWTVAVVAAFAAALTAEIGMLVAIWDKYWYGISFDTTFTRWKKEFQNFIGWNPDPSVHKKSKFTELQTTTKADGIDATLDFSKINDKYVDPVIERNLKAIIESLNRDITLIQDSNARGERTTSLQKSGVDGQVKAAKKLIEKAEANNRTSGNRTAKELREGYSREVGGGGTLNNALLAIEQMAKTNVLTFKTWASTGKSAEAAMKREALAKEVASGKYSAYGFKMPEKYAALDNSIQTQIQVLPDLTTVKDARLAEATRELLKEYQTDVQNLANASPVNIFGWNPNNGFDEAYSLALNKVGESAAKTDAILAELFAFETHQKDIDRFQTKVTDMAAEISNAGVEMSKTDLFKFTENGAENIQQLSAKLARLKAKLEDTVEFADANVITVQIKAAFIETENAKYFKDKTVSPLAQTKTGLDALQIQVPDKLINALTEEQADRLVPTLEGLKNLREQNDQLRVGSKERIGNEGQIKVVSEAISKEITKMAGENTSKFGASALASGLAYPTDRKVTAAQLKSRVGITEQINKLKEEINDPNTDAPRAAQASNEIYKLEKRLNPELIVKSMDQFLSTLQSLGATPNGTADLARYSKTQLDELKKMAEDKQSRDAARSKGMQTPEKAIADALKDKADSKRAAEMARTTLPKSFNEKFSKIKDAGIELDLSKYLKGGDALNEATNMVERLRIATEGMNDETLAPAIQEGYAQVFIDTTKAIEQFNIANKSFGEQFTDVNSAIEGSSLTMMEWALMTGSERKEITALVAKLKELNDEIAKGGTPTKPVTDSIKEKAEAEIKLKKQIAAGKNPTQNKLDKLTAAGGTNTSLGYKTASKSTREWLDKKANRFDELADEIKTLESGGKVTDEIEAKLDAIYKEQAILTGDVGRVTSLLPNEQNDAAAFSNAGVNIDQSTLERFDKVVKDKFKNMNKAINDATIEYAKMDDGAEKTAAGNLIRAKVKKLNEELVLASMDPDNTQAFAAGKNMSDNMRSSFTTGMSDFLKGKGTFKDAVINLATRYSESLTDSFVEGMASALFKKDGLLDSFFKMVSIDAFNFGSSIFGGNGEEEASKQALLEATNNLTIAMQNLGNTISGFGGGAKGRDGTNISNGKGDSVGGSVDPAFGVDPVTGMGRDVLGYNLDGTAIVDSTQVQTELLVESDAKSTQAIGGFMDNLTKVLHGDFASLGPLFSSAITGIMGMFTGGGSSSGGLGGMLSGAIGGLGDMFSGLGESIGTGIGEIFGMEGAAGWLSGLFLAGGGQVKGAGTAVSDSIPAMLSNGEFVINAKSASKHRNLLEALNSGRMPKFATGGLVGAMAGSNALTLEVAKRDGETKKTPKQQSVFNINVTGDISRQTRNEIQQMIPNIAMGVNHHNKELGLAR